jgi:hypothetical protein
MELQATSFQEVELERKKKQCEEERPRDLESKQQRLLLKD